VKRRIFSTIVFLALLGAGIKWLSQKRIRDDICHTMNRLNSAVDTADRKVLAELISSPAYLLEKAPEERGLLMMDLLKDEISKEGIEILMREGKYGALQEIFPNEATPWAKSFDVNPEDCVAFRLNRNDLTAELVLHRQTDGSFRVLRCNDIRQLANTPSQP
jgi:hypothetical protein